MKKLHILIFSLSVYVLNACTDSEGIYPMAEDKEIVVIFAPDALGDNGYNDLIYRGILKYIRDNRNAGIRFTYYNPTSLEEGEHLIEMWRTKDNDAKNSLLVLPTTDYVNTVMEQFGNSGTDTTCQRILCFESTPIGLPGVSTFDISMYGASYIAGGIAGIMALTPMMALANPRDVNLSIAADGFRDGFRDFAQTGDKDVALAYLSDADTGYVMADSTYIRMFDWARQYNFIFPVMGGSNMGIFRYLRQYPQGIYTIGTDTYQSHYCNQIIGSIVKDMDLIINECLNSWVSDGRLLRHKRYDLGSGHIGFLLSEAYEEFLKESVEELRPVAIQKENEYEAH